MKKVKKFLLGNIKPVIAFVIGGLIFGAIGVYAATTLLSQSVYYNNSTSGASSTNVRGAIDELYTIASKCPNPYPSVKIGDYISLTPTKNSYTIKASLTGYETDQTINPSELNLWRVIDIHSDGSFDAVSEYVSSTVVYFRDTPGYANFVGALNTIVAQYQVPGYTIGSRHMGYGGQTSIIGDTSAFDGTTKTPPSTTSTPSPTTGTGEEYSGGVLGDTLYLKDYLLVKNVYGSSGLKAYKTGTTTVTAYWLASRRFYYNSATRWGFVGRFVSTSGVLGSRASYFRLFNNSSFVISPISYAVRPILTLKSGITTSGGNGTKDSPYTLS